MAALLDSYQRIPVGEIIVDRDKRQRRNIDPAGLEQSIARLGVLHPIIITRDKKLIAGERRLAASIKLELPDIPVRYADELSEHELLIVELEENVRREDLSWQEIASATQRIHQLYCQMEETWNQVMTAERLSVSEGYVSLCLSVGKQLDDPRIANAQTIRDAHTIIKRRQNRLDGEALEEFLGGRNEEEDAAIAGMGDRNDNKDNANGVVGVDAESGVLRRSVKSVINRDFRDWAANYKGKKFNLIHCDFPYGIEAFSGPKMRSLAHSDGANYDDSEETFHDLLYAFGEHFEQFASVTCHVMFWCTAYPPRMYDLLGWFANRLPSLEFYKFPLIWVKSDNKGITTDAGRWPRHTYECCLLGSRGRRPIVRVTNDHYVCATASHNHPSAKPYAMLRHFMSMLVDDSTLMLDPTCGAGSSLRAAESLGAKRVLGIEINEQMAELAEDELRKMRLMRKASEGVR